MNDYRNGELRPGLLRYSRALRQRSTSAEQVLWRLLRARQLADAKFRRQHPYGPYVLDFLCAERGLVVELDGDSHASARNAVWDAQRTEFLEHHGLRVLRFTNREVMEQTEAVLQRLYAELNPAPSP